MPFTKMGYRAAILCCSAASPPMRGCTWKDARTNEPDQVGVQMVSRVHSQVPQKNFVCRVATAQTGAASATPQPI
jgi:hypothetical protein